MTPSNTILNLQNVAYHRGDLGFNKRTNQNVKTLYNTSLMYFDDTDKFSNTNFFIMPEGRCVFPYIAAAELCWALTGEKNTALIKKYSSMWDKFSNEKGEVETAYGYRMRRHFGRDQLFELIDLLNKDKSTRQGLIMYWDPVTDGLMSQGSVKNVPCPFAWQVNVTSENELQLTLFMRSSDLVVGLPYDFMFYDQLALALANELKIKKNNIAIFSANSHLYEEHEPIVIQQLMLDETIFLPKYYSTKFSLSEIMIDPEAYIEEIRGLCSPDVEKRKEIYNPKPEVFE
jgi:thymidylate synthase